MENNTRDVIDAFIAIAAKGQAAIEGTIKALKGEVDMLPEELADYLQDDLATIIEETKLAMLKAAML